MTPWGQPTVKKPYAFFKGPAVVGGLENYLQDLVPDARWLIAFGAVYVNGKRAQDPQLKVQKTDVLRVHTEPKRYLLDRENLKTRIVFENENYLVLDKPSGLPMHPTLDNMFENLLYGFEFPLFVTHRLDVPTSGLVVVAKNKEFQTAFNRLISMRHVQKVYQAKVAQPLPTGELLHYMKKTKTAPKSVVKFKPQDLTEWQDCRLVILESHQNRLKIELLTGRTHQIRAQLAFEGSPILGDEMYGGPPDREFGLKSSFLSFQCPFSFERKSFELTSKAPLA